MFSEYSFSNGFATIMIVLLLLFLIPTIFYFLALQRALEAVSEENRRMPPGQVWLSLIPIFNFVWMFYVVNKISESFKAEFVTLNIESTEENPTKGIGNAKNILRICSLLPVIKGVASLIYIVLWVMHWVKVYQCKQQILANKDNVLLDAEKGIFSR